MYPQAAAALRAIVIHEPTSRGNIDYEGAVSAEVKLEASAKGARLWRNNVGAGKLDNGNFIRWGLMNDTTQINKQVKSADLIGIRPVLITPDKVGSVIGQFLSRETKRPGWKYSPNDEHTAAQIRWAELILSLGGDAGIVTGTGSI